MKIFRLFSGVLLLVSLFAVTSCDLLNGSDGSSNSSSSSSSSSSSTTTKYTVTFDTNGGSYLSSKKVEDGNALEKPTDPTKKGYSFVGWFSDKELNNEYDFKNAVTKNITIYAKWSIESYTVSFNVKGGNETIPSQTVEYNKTLTKPTNPTKDGYSFAGWYSSSLYSDEFNFSSGVTKNMTLYAKWTEIPKTVKYDVGDAIVDMWTDSVGTKWIKIGVPVTNTGTANLYTKSSTATIETQTGQLLQSVSYISCYPECLKPGETGYYYKETSCDFNETNIKVSFNANVEKASVDVIRYDVSDVSISAETYGGIKIIGRVTNNTREKAVLAQVAINMFDSSDNWICTRFTYIYNDIAPGSQDSFSMSSYAFVNMTPSDVAKYEAYAYPNQINW